jgi:subtilisin family serine protease
MAAPHVAGLVALLISAEPELAGQVNRLEEIITQSALRIHSTQNCGGDTPTSVPNNVYGWGRIDALAAFAQSEVVDVFMPIVDPG